MKFLAALSVAVAAAVQAAAPAPSAEAVAAATPASTGSGAANAPDPTRVIQPHAETARAMLCLLGADPKAPCRDDFYEPARLGATRFMSMPISQRNFELGALVSVEYVYTQSQNAYTTAFLHGRTSDVYRVVFKHQDITFYIARPDPDGKIHNWLGRNGAPGDEKTDPVGLSRIR